MSKLAAIAVVALLLQTQQSPLVRPVPKEDRVERLMELSLEELFRAPDRAAAVGLSMQRANWKGSPAPRIEGVSLYVGTRPPARPVVTAGARVDTGAVQFLPPPDALGARRMGSCPNSTIEAMRILARQAKAQGANAVIDIRSDAGNPAYDTPWAVVCKGSEVRLTGVVAVLEEPPVRAVAGSRPPR